MNFYLTSKLGLYVTYAFEADGPIWDEGNGSGCGCYPDGGMI